MSLLAVHCRVAAVRYSSGAAVFFDFDDWLTKEGLQMAVAAIPYVGKSTATGLALNTTRVDLIEATAASVGRRVGVDTVVIGMFFTWYRIGNYAHATTPFLWVFVQVLDTTTACMQAQRKCLACAHNDTFSNLSC